MKRFAFALTALFGAIAIGAAQQPQTPKTSPQQEAAAAPAANPADVSSPDAILAALYDVISGPAGQKRDWERFRSLFLPGARLIPAGPLRAGLKSPRVLTPDDYVAAASVSLEKNGFYEREFSRRSERFGAILHAFSTYESRHAAQDAAPFARGINSIQLYGDGTRWWIVTVLWQAETAELHLPAEFLPGGK